MLPGTRGAVYEVTCPVTGYVPQNLATEFGYAFYTKITGSLKDKSQPVKVSIAPAGTMKWKLNVGIPAKDAPLLTKNSVGELKLIAGFMKVSNSKKIIAGSKTLTVTKLDLNPVLTGSKMTLNAWSKDGSVLPIVAQEGNPITKINLLYQGVPSTYFTVSARIDGSYVISPAEAARNVVKNSGNNLTQELTLQAVTASGTLSKPYTITVSNTKPAVTMTLLKRSNTYYTKDTYEACAQYRITSAYGIESVKINAAAKAGYEASWKPYYDVSAFDASTGILTLRPAGPYPAQDGSIKKNITLDITAGGYYAAPYKLKVETEDTKPVITAQEAVIYDGYDAASVVLNAPLPEGTSVTCTDTSVAVNFTTGRNEVRVRALAGFTPGNKKLKFSNPAWRKNISITVAVSKKAVPAMKLSEKNITLNSALGCDEYGMQTVTASVKGSPLEVSTLVIKGKNSSAQYLLDSGYLRTLISGNALKLGLVPMFRDEIKAGTYKFDVTGTVNDGSLKGILLKSVTLTVKISDKAPTSLYKLKGKGTINIVDRADTYIKYTPTITGLNAKSVKAVSLTGENASMFTVALCAKGTRLPNGKIVKNEQGAIVLRAREGVTLKNKAKYEVWISSTLDNGLVLLKKVNVKPKQSPKKTKGPKSLNLSINGRAASYTITSAGLTANDSVIKKVELVADDSSACFDYVPESGAGNSRSYAGTIKVNKNIKKLGTYKLTFRVTYKDHAENVKPKKVTLKVKVK